MFQEGGHLGAGDVTELESRLTTFAQHAAKDHCDDAGKKGD